MSIWRENTEQPDSGSKIEVMTYDMHGSTVVYSNGSLNVDCITWEDVMYWRYVMRGRADEELASMVNKILEYLPGWELSESPRLRRDAMVAVNDKYAMSFGKDRDLLRVRFTLHPDINFNRKQKTRQYASRFTRVTPPKACAEIIKERLIPKVIAHTDELTINE